MTTANALLGWSFSLHEYPVGVAFFGPQTQLFTRRVLEISRPGRTLAVELSSLWARRRYLWQSRN